MSPFVVVSILGKEIRGGLTVYNEGLFALKFLWQIAVFDLIGMAISIRFRHVRTPLAICGFLVAGYAIGIACNSSYVIWGGYGDPHWYGHCFSWPLKMGEWRWDTYDTLDFAADLLCGIVVPAVCVIWLFASFGRSLEE